MLNPIKQHHFCSAGKLSWCKWQQEVAIGIKTYKGDDCLPKVFLELLHPPFVTLSDSKLSFVKFKSSISFVFANRKLFSYGCIISTGRKRNVLVSGFLEKPDQGSTDHRIIKDQGSKIKDH